MSCFRLSEPAYADAAQDRKSNREESQNSYSDKVSGECEERERIDDDFRINFTDEGIFHVAIIELDSLVNKRSTTLKIIVILYPHILKISIMRNHSFITKIQNMEFNDSPQMFHLLLQILENHRIIIANEWQRGVIRSTKIARLMEGHRRADVHVASVEDEVPSWRAFSSIENRLIVHVKWQILDLEQGRIIGSVTNSRTDCKCLIPVPEIVCRIDFCLVNISRTVPELNVESNE